MPKRKLLIVSDTRMQQDGNQFWAFNSVVKELDVFVKFFDEIIWIGFDYKGLPLDGTLLNIKHTQVKPIAVRKSGGTSLISKLGILRFAPKYLYLIWKYSKDVDLVHSRGPSVPMFFALILSYAYHKPKWWFKYANDWNDSRAALSWKLQKKLMLLNKNCVGTINGHWPGTPAHIIPFENPCLDYLPIEKESKSTKRKANRMSLLYVGRIELKKGFNVVLDAINSLPEEKIEKIQIIGDGLDRALLLKTITQTSHQTKIEYLGSCTKEEVFAAMRAADLLLLPTTASEGFPKVIAEAWFNGCIPVVSNVSSIPQYVKDGVNGFIWEIEGKQTFSEILDRAMSTNIHLLHNIREMGFEMCSKFTYDWYEKQIRTHIINV